MAALHISRISGRISQFSAIARLMLFMGLEVRSGPLRMARGILVIILVTLERPR